MQMSLLVTSMRQILASEPLEHIIALYNVPIMELDLSLDKFHNWDPLPYEYLSFYQYQHVKCRKFLGGGSGIGRAICQVLAREGARVIASDKNSESVAETVAMLEGPDHIALTIDVVSSKSVNEAFQSSLKRYAEPPTIVVNSAGITRDNYLLKLSEEDFDQVLNVNLKGTFLVTQTAVKAMIEAGVSEGGSVVNIGSIIGRLGNIGQCNYSASKAGVEAMTKSASMEFGKFGVRINAVLPGLIKSPMTDAIPEHLREIMMRRSPLGRIGNPSEIAEVVTFLCSNKSSFVNGAAVEVTGGFH